MTNELEKQFFDTFGIEPRLVESCTKPRHKCSEKFVKDCSECPRAWRKYPQITDRILLELICKTKGLVITEDCNSVEQLKDGILKVLISLAQVNKDIEHQVRTLFEEG